MKSPQKKQRGPIYRYNAKTCRYEPANLSLLSIFSYAFGLLICSVLMLGGMLFVHDMLIDSDNELALKKENKAYEKGHLVLTGQLDQIEGTLRALQQKDADLHRKFFAREPFSESISHNPTRKKILLSDPLEWRAHEQELAVTSAKLLSKSAASSTHFANEIDLSSGRNILRSIPWRAPVENFELESVMSGFGERINPFHKGLYKHLGIDIALPRGTNVVAPAQGFVILAKYSSLQAGLGTYLEIDHGNGFVTRYANLEDIKVRKGEFVTKGSVIAISGNSGGSVAPHLHYEVLRFGTYLDPVKFIIENFSSEQHAELRELANTQNQSLD